MAAVSQGLIDFANHFRQPASPGVEVIETPRYTVTLQPDFPIPGPNSAAWVRCDPTEVDEVIREVRTVFASRRLPFMWIIDPETEPVDLGDRLTAIGVMPESHSPEVAVMVLPIGARLDAPPVAGLEMRDALADPELFRQADMVNTDAFEAAARDAGRVEQRRQNHLAAGNKRVLLATVDGEPAGSAGVTFFRPAGAILNGGAVREKFRGRGVYRALVVERLGLARKAGLPGLTVWGGPMSAPILAKLGFEKVGWRRFHLDPSISG